MYYGLGDTKTIEQLEKETQLSLKELERSGKKARNIFPKVVVGSIAALIIWLVVYDKIKH